MFNMTFPCTTTMGATDPARCLTHHPPYPHHPSIHWRQSLNYQYRLCSFPSPPRFTKPCDIEDTDRPFCYTRIKEAGISFKTSFFCLFWNLLFTQRGMCSFIICFPLSCLECCSYHIIFNFWSKQHRDCLQDGNEFGDGNQNWGYCQVLLWHFCFRAFTEQYFWLRSIGRLKKASGNNWDKQ